MSAGEREPVVLCRIQRCAEPARWIYTMIDHPNAPGISTSAYCHDHAAESARILWDESPRPYRKAISGPYGPAELRRALGAVETAAALEDKREQIAEIARRDARKAGA